MTAEKLESRAKILAYFRQVAEQENAKNRKIDFGDLLDKNDKKRVLFVMPESIGDLFICTSLFKSIRVRYPRPNWAFYVATKPQYKDILNGNQYVDHVIDYIPQMDSLLWLEGSGSHKGWFDVAYLGFCFTQRFLNWTHNSCDKIDLNLDSPCGRWTVDHYDRTQKEVTFNNPIPSQLEIYQPLVQD